MDFTFSQVALSDIDFSDTSFKITEREDASDLETSILSVCPVGTYFVRGQNACIPKAVESVVSVVQTVEFTVCGGGGGGNGSGDGSNQCTQNSDCPEGYFCNSVYHVCQKQIN